MTNEAREQEIWKVYSKYPWIEASNLGRVRTKDRYVTGKNGSKRFVKGRILKQHLTKDGYLYVSTSIDGKNISLRVSRIVASCFHPNPNNLPEVDHIDCNPSNNVASNLRWCTRQENITHRDELGHTAKHNAPKKPVFAVDLKTNKVLKFESQSEAARQLGIAQENVNAVVNGRLIQTHGYWFTEDEGEITEERIQKIKNSTCFHNEVFAVDPKTGKVMRFDSQAEAGRQLGIDKSHIGSVIKGQRETAKGYWFTDGESKITEEKIQEIKGNMRVYFLGGVIAIDLKAQKVLYFEKQSEAACQLGISRVGVNDVLKGRQKSSHDCWFTYADENAIEKVRSKFGDEMAEKVEKLMSNIKNI